MNNKTKIEFAAQYGGRDAFGELRPHFFLLKKAAENISLSNFPYQNLTFILRASGNITEYSGFGFDNPDVSSKDNYISVDIVIHEGVWKTFDRFLIDTLEGLNSYLKLLVESGKMHTYDEENLSIGMKALSMKYLSLLNK